MTRSAYDVQEPASKSKHSSSLGASFLLSTVKHVLPSTEIQREDHSSQCLPQLGFTDLRLQNWVPPFAGLEAELPRAGSAQWRSRPNTVACKRRCGLKEQERVRLQSLFCPASSIFGSSTHQTCAHASICTWLHQLNLLCNPVASGERPRGKYTAARSSAPASTSTEGSPKGSKMEY